MRVILLLLTLVVRKTLVVAGAHLKETPALPELLPLAAVKLIVTGFVVQTTFGEDGEARTEA